MKIKLASIPVNDPKEAFSFYTQVLGFLEKVYVPEANLAIVVSPEEQDGTAILLEPTDNPTAKTFHEALFEQGLPIIVLDSRDAQKEYERLKELGVSFTQEPTKTEWGTVAVFDDTCGNLVQIHQD